jgi:ATP-dependent protease ClpP protease subunit
MQMYIIPIYGLIGDAEDENDKDKHFTLADMAMHINAAREHDSIMLDVGSWGGSVDDADEMEVMLIATKKTLFSKNSGDVASAASKLFCLASKENRTFDPARGVFLIHNPYVAELTGDSAFLKEASKDLQEIEDRYAKAYAQATGADIGSIKTFMKINKPLTSEQVESLGFATIKKAEFKPVATFKKKKIKNDNSMKNEDIVKELSVLGKAFKGITDAVKALAPKALMLVDADGTELDFPDIQDETMIAVDVAILQAGAPASGSFVMSDGSTIVAVEGVVTEIIPVETDDDLEALKTENAELKAAAEVAKTEIEAAKAETAKAETASAETQGKVDALSEEVKTVNKAIATLSGKFSKGTIKGATPSSEGDDDGKPVKFGYGKTRRTEGNK